MNKKIDERDRQIIELFRQGKTYKQIAEVLFYNEATIYIRIKKMKDAGIIDEIIINERKNNIAYLKQKKLSETNEQIIQLLEQGKTRSEIAYAFNLTTNSIYQKVIILHEAGKLSQDIIEQNPTLAYLKEIIIDNAQLKELFKQGKTYREIAEVFNCSESHILRKINILKQSGEINKEILAEREKNKKQMVNDLTIKIIELYKKGRKDVTVFSMAMANVTGNPKRTIATILTMGLSCVLFVIISNYVGNIDTEHEARIAINHGQFELQLDYSQNYDEAYPENNLDTILQNNPLNDSLIKEIKSIPGVTDVLTREIVSADLNGTKFPVAIINQEDFEMMREDGDIGSMDYAQAVKNGDVFFGWSTWMEADGYSAGAPITFNFDNGSGTYTYHGKIAGSFVSADTYLVIPEEVYRSVNPKETSYGYLWVDCAKKDVASST